MSDLERLDEVLPTYDNMVLLRTEAMRALSPNGFKVLAQMERAVLAYRDLLANGERVWWCEVHGAMGGSDDPGECVYAPRYATACRIDDRLLVEPPTEVEPGEET